MKPGTFAGACTTPVASPPDGEVVVAPSTFELAAGGSMTFSAEVRDPEGNPLDRAVTWGAEGGSITGSGEFTAGTAGGAAKVWARADGALPDTVAGTITGGTGPSAAIDTIFFEDFESGSLGVWDDGVDGARHRILTDASLAPSGTRLLEITYPDGSDGGWLTKFFMPGYDSTYLSYRVRLQSGWQGGTKLIGFHGSRSDDMWSGFGQAGRCPTGTDFFAANVVTDGDGDPGNVRFYTYYPGMRREPDGTTCYGRYGDGSETYVPPLALTPGEWHHIEFFVRLNTPGQSDGVQRIWVDGTLRGEWEDMVIRTSTILRLNSVTISASMPPGAPMTERMYVDRVLVTNGRP